MQRASARIFAAVVILAVGLLTLGQASPEPAPIGDFQRYAVAADHALASQAGAELLAAGGNAADAAAATMLALGVVSPGSSGLGGGGFAVYYDASEGSVTFLDFRERAPAAATPDMYRGQESQDGPASNPSQLGGLATGVPGEPAGIDELIRRFGSKPRSEIVEPAARYAERGFEITEYIARMTDRFATHMKRDPVMASWFEGDAAALRAGQTVRMPELARTLRTFGSQGSAPFYRGAIARQIVAANRRNGGVMTMADLRDYRVVEREPLELRRMGHRWVTAPPPSAGGYTMLASLGLLDRWVPRERRSEAGAELMHAFAESWKGPFWDRSSYFGDPDHVDVPVDRLLDDERIARRATAFRPTLAVPVEWYAMPLAREDQAARQPDNAGTSHLCVVDAEGNVASITTTINLPFGARYTAAGMVMNDEMDDFASEIGEQNAFGLPGGAPNLPGPGKRPVSTMTPTIVFDEGGRPVLCVGAAGGSRIVTATQQVAWHTLVRGLDPREALAHPRVHHQGVPNTLRVETEQPLAPAIVAQLRARGHVIEEVSHSAIVQLIRIRYDGGPRLTAASDPRKGGLPAGE